MAGSALVPRSYIYIGADSAFTAENGVVGGSGTQAAPYVLAGWDINVTNAGMRTWDTGIYITHTRAHFLIRDVYIHADGYGGTQGAISLQDSPNGRVENVTFGASSLLIGASSNTTVAHAEWPRGGVIEVSSSSDVRLEGNVLQSGSSSWGGTSARIGLYSVTRVAVTDNIIHSVDPCQICMWNVVSATLSGNRMDSDGIALHGTRSDHFDSHTIAPDNLVNGAPVRYVKDQDGLSLVGGTYGQVIIANVTGAFLWGLRIDSTLVPMQVAFSRNVLVAANRMDNTMTHAARDSLGSYLFGYALTISDSENVSVAMNEIRSVDVAVWFLRSRNAAAYGNSLTAIHATALVFEETENGTASYNNVTGTWKPVWIGWSRNVTVFRNNFYEFGQAPTVAYATNASFDRGYPEGGNYWFDYRGMDNCAGPLQWDCERSDGIGDVWYVINATLQDRFPLMEPVSLAEPVAATPEPPALVSPWTVLGVAVMVAVGLAALYRWRGRR